VEGTIKKGRRGRRKDDLRKKKALTVGQGAPRKNKNGGFKEKGEREYPKKRRNYKS